MRGSLKELPLGGWAKIWAKIEEWKEGHQTYIDIANEEEGEDPGAGLRLLIDVVHRELDSFLRFNPDSKPPGLPGRGKRTAHHETKKKEIGFSKRGQALSDILAVLGAGNEDIKEFREEVLSGQLLQPEEVPAWIEAASERGCQGLTEESIKQVNLIADSLRKIHPDLSVRPDKDVLSYNDPASDGWLRRIAISNAGVLGRLKKLAKKYEAFWPEAGAVQFILTGKAPPISQASVRHKLNSYGLNKIVLEVSPHLSGDKVRSLFLQEKQRSLGFKGMLAGGKRKSKTRRLNPESMDLAVLAAETPGPWPRKMDKWNYKFPALKYKHPSTFEVDCKAAFERVTGWRWEDCFDSLK